MWDRKRAYDEKWMESRKNHCKTICGKEKRRICKNKQSKGLCFKTIFKNCFKCIKRWRIWRNFSRKDQWYFLWRRNHKSISFWKLCAWNAADRGCMQRRFSWTLFYQSGRLWYTLGTSKKSSRLCKRDREIWCWFRKSVRSFKRRWFIDHHRRSWKWSNLYRNRPYKRIHTIYRIFKVYERKWKARRSRYICSDRSYDRR